MSLKVSTKVQTFFYICKEKQFFSLFLCYSQIKSRKPAIFVFIQRYGQVDLKYLFKVFFGARNVLRIS